MQINKFKQEIFETINYILDNLENVSKFTYYSHSHDEAKDTGEMIIILGSKTNNIKKTTISNQDLERFLNFCISHYKFPQFDDNNFQIARNYILSNNIRYSIPRETLLLDLAKKLAGLEKNYWISQNLKYKIPERELPMLFLRKNLNPDNFIIMIGSFIMIEDGLVFTIENTLNNFIKEKFGTKIFIDEKKIEIPVPIIPKIIAKNRNRFKDTSQKPISIANSKTYMPNLQITQKKVSPPKELQFGIKSNAESDENNILSPEEKAAIGRKKLLEKRTIREFENIL